MSTCISKYRSIGTFVLTIFIFSITFPIVANAKVADYIRIGDEQNISRGDFIRASVKALKIKQGNGEMNIPYRRVPKALRPYVEAAHIRGSLKIFSNDLQLARGITRGQALYILMRLKSLKGDSRKLNYLDVKKGTLEAEAVSVALRRKWMIPQGKNHFGIRRLLKGAAARELLQRVIGESVTTIKTTKKPVIKKSITKNRSVPTVKINIKSRGLGKSSRNIPNIDILEAVWKYITNYYIYEDKIDPKDAAYSAAEAMVRSLGDPYSVYLRPAGINSLETQIRGTVTGIGAQVEQRNGILTIVSPLRLSPAERAGLKPNDEILKVNGIDITNMPFLDAVNHVRGPKGTTVELTIRRNGKELKIKVVRDLVKVPEIEITWHDSVAVVRIMQFGKTTENELRGALADVQKQNPKGIIIDLRSNPGGLLHAADLVVSNFVPKGSVVANIISRDGTRIDKTMDEPTIKPNVPVVVLVNEGSASASEIVAGALQDHGRVTVVGTKTFGKGTVQQVVRFNDDSGLKITIAEWKTPNGRKINGVGVTPDIKVEYKTERDEQMLKALEILR